MKRAPPLITEPIMSDTPPNDDLDPQAESELQKIRRERAQAAIVAEWARAHEVKALGPAADAGSVPPPALVKVADDDQPAGDGNGRPPTWLRIAVPVAALAAIGVGLVVSRGPDDSDQRADVAPVSAPSTTRAEPTTTVEPTTTTAASTTTTTAIPATVVATEPTHRATYRDGKLILDGTIPSAEAGAAYVEKAAAVIGPDNVINNYVVDPSVPESNDGTVYVDEPFLFRTGSAELDPAYFGVLNLGVAAMTLSPNARMVVTGYTDDVGDPLRNLQLSTRRAEAVRDYMVFIGGIAADRFETIGAGEANPVADNATEDGRRLNRRIDVKLVNLIS